MNRTRQPFDLEGDLHVRVEKLGLAGTVERVKMGVKMGAKQVKIELEIRFKKWEAEKISLSIIRN